MDKKKYIIIVVALVIAVIAGSVVVKNIKNKKAEDAATVQTDLGIPIELTTVSRDNMVEDISYIGTIASKKSAVVSPAIGGQIKEIYFEEGSMVQVGDLLAKIDDEQLSASYATSQRKLETLKTSNSFLNAEVSSFYSTNPLVKKLETLTSNYEYIKGESEKFKKLYDEGAVSKSAYDKIKQEEDTLFFQMNELKATIDDAYNKLSHERDMTGSQINELASAMNEMAIKIEDTLIKAPIEGVVKKIYYDEGDLAIMGRPFADIDNNDELLVKVNITESDLNKIEVGNKAMLKVKGLSNEITSTVSKIIPNVNPSTRIGIVEIGPIKAEEGVSFVSGNSVEVDIVIDEVQDKLIIPKSTIKILSDQSIVYLYQDGMVKETPITTGLTVGENIEVVEGLKEGDKIAVKNLSKLYKDAKVYVFKGVDK